MITISQAMDRLKLREVKPGHIREDAAYRARRRNAARIVRRHMDGRRSRLEDLAYVAPPAMLPRTPRRADKVANELVTAAFRKKACG